MTVTECFELGYRDALSACRESGEFTAPDGGWDSWLINGVGIRATYEALGEPYVKKFDWSEAMRAKLTAYDKGALEGSAAAAAEHRRKTEAAERSETNAYRVVLAPGHADVGDWWHSTNNPFRHHYMAPLKHGDYLLMADVCAENDERLERAPWCASYSECRVDSPQAGDGEPAGEHETIDGGEQMLWVS